MSKRITIKEIAKALNVSVSTVSKALNDSYEIGEETKKRVKYYAQVHNYKPNTLALSLQNKKTHTIGIIIPNILNHFFARVLKGIEKHAADNGYNIITCITNESYTKEVNTIEMLSNGMIDGFIACISEETLRLEKFDHFQKLIDDDTPLVLYDRVHKNITCDKVVIDNIKSAYKATRFLMKSGCENIALISTIDSLNVGKFRAQGYLKALTNYGIKPNENLIIRLENDINLKERVSKMLEKNKVDGIFTVDEVSGAVTVQVLNARKTKIPDEVSIIGFTNGILSKYSVPALTTVNQFGIKIGEKAAQKLIAKIEGKIEPKNFETIIVKTELIERDSTKKMFNTF